MKTELGDLLLTVSVNLDAERERFKFIAFHSVHVHLEECM